MVLFNAVAVSMINERKPLLRATLSVSLDRVSKSYDRHDALQPNHVCIRQGFGFARNQTTAGHSTR